MTDITQNTDAATATAPQAAPETTTIAPATAAVDTTVTQPQLASGPAPATAAYDSLHAQVMSDPVAVNSITPIAAVTDSRLTQAQADLAAASSTGQAGSLIANDPLLDKVGKLLNFIGHDVGEFREIVALARKLVAK
ncbi:hypothetical protein [Pantoea sp. BAV 3049]|uniref:hypothetical protein n=1 Tax=Pantoea sp. BAV 3049 TaxID=2654188 RepID=UPI00131B2D72|nr:hypothetical protein [Pantoea sp. BAV 3049]